MVNGINNRKIKILSKDGPVEALMMTDVEVFAIKAAQKGDEAAWRKLFDLHFGGIYRYGLTLASGRQDCAEEITQQVFFIAARRIGKFDPAKAAFRSWLYGIARNVFMKLEVKQVSQRFHETQILKEQKRQSKPDVSNVEIYDTLGQLPSHYRAILEAKYFERLSVKEIADRNGSSVKAIESLLARARKEFEQIYRRKMKE